jgi:hypothetical protein
MCLLLFAASANAQPSETVHEVGKDGLTIDGQVARNDAKVKVTLVDGKIIEIPAKRHLVKLLAGKTYFVTLRSKAIDSFLIVEDAAGKQIDYDDDSTVGFVVAQDRATRMPRGFVDPQAGANADDVVRRLQHLLADELKPLTIDSVAICDPFRQK